MKLALSWNEQGLVPVVVQDRLTGQVRMLAYANEEAVLATLTTRRATFYSRSRQELWEKGKTSGNTISVADVFVDCDGDALIYASTPKGPSCHTGEASCFHRAMDSDGSAKNISEAREEQADISEQTMLTRLEAVLEARKTSTATSSYTKSLYEGGAARIGEKLREEAGELAAAIASESDERVASEAADVIFHLVVGLRQRGVLLSDVLATLDARFGTSGHEEKASRAPSQK